jgi:hypothetical protein
MDENIRFGRRMLMLGTAGLMLSGVVSNSNVMGADWMVNENNGKGLGKPGDFDFLAGYWTIKNRRRNRKGVDEWDEFDGEASCWTILDGVGSVEELRIPDRKFAGMGLRLLDVEKKIWHDHWVNAKSGVLATPGQTGVFEDGVGTFEADDLDGDKPIKVKGVWDRITESSCRWYQAASSDDGKTWEENWSMDWTRVKPANQPER